MKNNFIKAFKDKTVLITGHTGFKGTWLTQTLLNFGSKIYGVSLPSRDFNSKFFDCLDLKKKIIEYRFDITEYKKLNELIIKAKPDYIFHLAAQSILSKSLLDPHRTFKTNYNGMLNLLESLRFLKKKCSVVLVTSDKVYENNNWIWGYRENDKLGGDDPYSASKSSSEILFQSYYKTFFRKQTNIRISAARAGNVFGGGDWSKDRLIPDILRSYYERKLLLIKNPSSTRPWQFVLEPINGYLILGLKNYHSKKFNGEAFNFGPNLTNHINVKSLLNEFTKIYPKLNYRLIKKNNSVEKNFLSLNSEKAINQLNWSPKLSFTESVKKTAHWYEAFYSNNDISEFTIKQIHEYFNL